MKKYLQEIFYLLGKDRHKLPGLILLFLGSSFLEMAGLGLIGPYIALIFDPQASDGLLGQIVETLGLPQEQKPLLIFMGLGLFILFFLKSMSVIWINYKIISFSKEQQIRLRSFLMQAYQSLPYTEYLRRNSSEYIHTIQTLVGQFSTGIILPGLQTLSDGIVALALISMLAWSSSTALAIMIVLFGSLIFFYDRVFRSKIRNYGEKSNVAEMAMIQAVNEGIEGLKEVRILGREKYFFDKVREETKQYTKFSSRVQFISIIPRYLLELMLISIFVFLVIVVLLMGQNMTALLPTIGMFGVAAIRLIPSANVLARSLIQLRFGRDAVSRLYNDSKNLEKIEIKHSKKGTYPNEDQSFNSLTLNKVKFRYPNTKLNALEGISITIQNGEAIGIIGPSGAGKTTLVDVLLGLLEPSEGEIRYNDVLLSESIDDWHTQCAYLPQQIFLIDSTLRNNVALGVENAEIDDASLEVALRKSFLHEYVNQLPGGVETVLGERGVKSSGGQRQRIALARAFYHGRNVLVMDEATSAIDYETEREIIEEIKKLYGKKTIIVIAHRLNTVQHCDRIYRLKEGRIIEAGTPKTMLKLNGNSIT